MVKPWIHATPQGTQKWVKRVNLVIFQLLLNLGSFFFYFFFSKNQPSKNLSSFFLSFFFCLLPRLWAPNTRVYLCTYVRGLGRIFYWSPNVRSMARPSWCVGPPSKALRKITPANYCDIHLSSGKKNIYTPLSCTCALKKGLIFMLHLLFSGLLFGLHPGIFVFRHLGEMLNTLLWPK